MPPVDLEMLSELLIFQGLELASEFKGYAIDATQGLLSRYHQIEGVEGVLLDAGSRLWCWLRQRLRPGETTKKEQLPFPLPAVFPLTLQHMDYITERFDDVKTQLQLIYAALDDLHTKRDQTDSKLSPLVKEKTCSHNTKALEKRLVDFRGETPVLQVDRLEVPLELAKPPTTLREDSSAILYWIIKAVDMDRGSDLEKIERRRAQNRTRQLRYLQKKRQYENDLMASVATLQTEMQRLQQYLHQIQSTESNSSFCPALSNWTGSVSTNILQTAQSFVRCFRSGFSPTEQAPWLPCVSTDQEQVRFVQRLIHPDVRHGELDGQNAFLEQWRRYTTFFGSLTLVPSSFELLSHGDEPESGCRVELTMSLDLISATFRNVFPHLRQPQYAGLHNRLMNQQIHVPMTLLLQSDDEDRVVRHDQSLDLVEALCPVLGSYEDVTVVLQDAHISSCGHICSDVSSVQCDARLALSFVLNVD
ncbi:hypothetical protein JG688_00009855 [Phytophthora aleatoria]|uniref:BZIP domain-containing protein n=1 Tax=Phytophthora aleatoria TaxID=2496075 RepID=A0A8J5IQZ9_9STRA|nr:hypothetical protein JG688_00009855 [Phytophthora aleatoria]